jgi:hypothetical protein
MSKPCGNLKHANLPQAEKAAGSAASRLDHIFVVAGGRLELPTSGL